MTARGAYIADHLNEEVLYSLTNVTHSLSIMTLDELRFSGNDFTDCQDWSRQRHVRSFKPYGQPNHDLGTLRHLPSEIVVSILAELDITSLANFRLSNRLANQFLLLCKEYRTVLRHAPAVIQGSLDISLENGPPIKKIFKKLFIEECEHCGDFGSLLYLPTCTRVCMLCLGIISAYTPSEYAIAQRQFGLDDDHMDTLPRWREFPNTWAATASLFPADLVDTESAYQAGIRLHESEDAMYNFAAQRAVQEAQHARPYALMSKGRFDNLVKHIVSDLKTHGKSPAMVRCGDLTRQMSQDQEFYRTRELRHAQVVRFPVLDRRTLEIKESFFCEACQWSCSLAVHGHRMFTIESFKKHLREYSDKDLSPQLRHDEILNRRLINYITGLDEDGNLVRNEYHLLPGLPPADIYLSKEQLPDEQ